MVADAADAFADKVQSVLERITSIAEYSDEITNRFSIVKVIEDIAFESNVLALHIKLNAVGGARPEHAAIHKPICEKYDEIAKTSALKTKKTAQFLSEVIRSAFPSLAILPSSKTKTRSGNCVISNGEKSIIVVRTPVKFKKLRYSSASAIGYIAAAGSSSKIGKIYLLLYYFNSCGIIGRHFIDWSRL